MACLKEIKIIFLTSGWNLVHEGRSPNNKITSLFFQRLDGNKVDQVRFRTNFENNVIHTYGIPNGTELLLDIDVGTNDKASPWDFLRLVEEQKQKQYEDYPL